VEKAEQLYEEWHGKQAKSLIDMEIPNLSLDEPLIVLGKMPEIMYRSSKYENRVYQYKHVFKKMPFLCSDSTGQIMVIVGGNFKITERGIIG